LELEAFALQFLPEYFLAFLTLCLVRAQLGRLPPVDANDVIVCHGERP
jgi:hypothetical protein